MKIKGDFMKKNFIISVVLAVIAFGLLIASLVLTIFEKNELCTYIAMGSSAVAFFSVLFGLGSWKEK